MTVSATNLHAQSVMTNAGTNILRDIKPPVEIPSGWAGLWWGVLVLAVAPWLHARVVEV